MPFNVFIQKRILPAPSAGSNGFLKGFIPRYLLIVAHLEHGKEGFAGYLHGTELAHALLAFLLLLQQLLLTGNITAV